MATLKKTMTCPRTGEPIILCISKGGATKLDEVYHNIRLFTPEQYEALPVHLQMEWQLRAVKKRVVA